MHTRYATACVYIPLHENIAEVGGEGMSAEEASDVRLLGWLESSGGLASLREQCSQHTAAGKPQAVYKLSLLVDPLALLQYSAHHGNELLHCPRQFWRQLQRLSYMAARSLGWLPGLSSSSQLLLVLRLSTIPCLPGYSISRPSDLPPLSSEPRFLSISGVVLAATLPSQYTESACYYCTMEECEGAREENRYIRLHVAGTSEASVVRSDFTCLICGSALAEDVAFRTLSNKVVVHLVPPHAFQNSPAPLPPSSPGTPSHHRYQATPIILRDELCEGVQVGGEYSVIGVPVYKLRETSQRALVSARLEANNLFPVHSEPVSLREVRAALPDTVADIHRACSYSPWAFSATLAYSFAAEIAPPGTYHRLKLALLLSLASCCSQAPPLTARCPLHLLAVATDTTLLPSLLRYASSLAPRSTSSSLTSDLWGATRQEEGEMLVEGGALVLASGGVCVVGNVQQLKREKMERLQRTLERSEVVLPLPLPREEGGAKSHGGQVLTWQLACAVWGFSVPGGRGAGNSHDSSAITKAFADSVGVVPPPSSVGVVMFCDCPTSDGADFLSELLTQHILDRATGTARAPPLSHSHLHQLLASVSGVAVALSPACQQLLRAFYLASRRVRASSLHGTDMPVNALDVMSGLAEAHARLSLRSEAVEEDGVMAILLYEEALASRYGHSVLSLLPAPHFRSTELSAYLGKQLDQQMRSLHTHIRHFCKCHASGASVGVVSPLTPEE